MKQKLHIISFDGLSKVDMEFLKNKPNFSRLLEDSAYSFDVQSVYPSLTYPAHTSIVTGNLPNKHGIINNTKVQPFRKNPDWFWYIRDVKTKTFQELVSENGYTVASIFWPVNGRSKVKYNMAEIFSNRPWSNQIMVSAHVGTIHYSLDNLIKFGSVIDRIKQPNLDHFIHQSYLNTLKNYKTDVTMVHYIDLDSIRHEYGFYSEEAYDALLRHDKRLGDILDTIEAEGESEYTTIVVLGDHSSKDFEKIIYLNNLFENHGLIIRKKTQVTSYELYGKGAGGSAYIYSKGNCGFKEVKNLLLNSEIGEGIEEIYDREEARQMGADPKCLMMLEGKEGYFFAEGFGEKSIINSSEIDFRKINDHGYSPFTKEDYETVFIAKGNKIKENVEIGPMRLIDEGPTFAKIFDLDLGNTDGRVLEEILK